VYCKHCLDANGKALQIKANIPAQLNGHECYGRSYKVKNIISKKFSNKQKLKTIYSERLEEHGQKRKRKICSISKGIGGANDDFANPEMLFAAGYAALFSAPNLVIKRKKSNW
jgi:hypothetical protein